VFDFLDCQILFLRISGYFIFHHIAPYGEIVKPYNVTLCNNAGLGIPKKKGPVLLIKEQGILGTDHEHSPI